MDCPDKIHEITCLMKKRFHSNNYLSTYVYLFQFELAETVGAFSLITTQDFYFIENEISALVMNLNAQCIQYRLLLQDGCTIAFLPFYAPRKISGEHIVAALSVRPSVSPSVRQSVRTTHSCPAHNFVI